MHVISGPKQWANQSGFLLRSNTYQTMAFNKYHKSLNITTDQQTEEV